MSTAGIRSNRGDYYQKLVAFDWALTVLDDSEYQWIEVDSVKYDVDDIVIGRTDGSVICCQCKKNHPNFKAWSLIDLSDELVKAYRLLDQNKSVDVRFYSRDSFGMLAKLRECSINQPDENSFNANLPKNLQATNSELTIQLNIYAPNLSSYEFISRTHFEITHDFDRMEQQLQERLRYMVTSVDEVYNALWQKIDKLGARSGDDASASIQHCLTKSDLKEIILKAGGVLSHPINSEDVRQSFASTSSIGRSWRRDIAGQYISRPILDEILSAINSRQRAILLTGLPGSGKTCVLLSLQDVLEKRAKTDQNIIPLFIQSREFADVVTDVERCAQGLTECWVEKAARLAEEAHVVVIIDSLDVLSIAREHKVLTYFLTQIDRLMRISNVTVVTACRDFDRNYDFRISQRQWDSEFKCGHLDWKNEVKPLLEKLDIDTSAIGPETHELIRNPRELALFVELAQREGRCNAVTSQELAQSYINTFIRGNSTLGDDALKAIEEIAGEMLKARRLSIPHQRVSIPDAIARQLSSLNIIKTTQGGELTFGHQTLLDVLVISGALRDRITLNEFIQNLPPVPFVRPCIRSFVEQLALHNRQDFRRQVRAVLIGNTAFHIRRLVAEAFAEQIPLDEDWPLIRNLKNNHKDVFQVIYLQARRVEWYHFWNKHLVPILFDLRDTEALSSHLFRTSLWKNEETKGILALGKELLQLDYMDKGQLSRHLSSLLRDIDDKYLEDAAPLLKTLLDLPRPEHTLLGSCVARYVSAGVISDIQLWKYIAGDITDEDAKEYRFSNKLHCESHEFGNNRKDFLKERMIQSVNLLDLAIDSIEKWSKIKSSHYGVTDLEYSGHFLHMTSYKNQHSQRDYDHEHSEDILFNAVEKAIMNHARMQSGWWKANSKRLCFNYELALRYFGILACTDDPMSNIDLIGCLLANKKILELPSLEYELGELIKSGFIYLDSEIQETIIKTVLSIYEDKLSDEGNHQWIQRERVYYISFMPCHLRSHEAQLLLDDYEKINGKLIPRPAIMSSGGFVRAPFSFDEFLCCSDDSVLRILSHYSGYKKSHDFDDFLIGGEEQVGSQLRQASSRQPTRFLKILSTNLNDLSCQFRDNIMDGIADHLAYRFGNTQPGGEWEPVDTSEGFIIASQVIVELEHHSRHWHHNRAASSAIRACSHVINDTSNASRLLFLCLGYVNYNEEYICEERDLIHAGINMTSGHIVEAVIILANNLLENNICLPDLFAPTLLRFARSPYNAHRALILRSLPFLQSKEYDLGWEIFHVAMECPAGLWKHAERCLYYAVNEHYDKIEPFLNLMYRETQGEELETWGRISALSSLFGHLEQASLLNNLQVKDSAAAWRGAEKVWTHPENIKQFREECLAGIEAGLNTSNIDHASVVAKEMATLFNKDNIKIFIPVDLVKLCFKILEADTSDQKHDFFGIGEWLNSFSQIDPEYALDVIEIYLNYVAKLGLDLYDYHNNYTQLITRLFAEAEECEEIDSGEMLKRVVSLQDTLLARGINNIDDWLKAAERP